ncbi:MAG: hypothetical protein IPG59_03165 [Candidatus Melainabacteria bacterium]|nr:MAG: hypothetical protein IPG59_03165 [Candidatus Melainabacteria bacterium]
MSDSLESVQEGPEKSNIPSIEPTSWDVGSSAPTTLSNTRFDIISNGTMNVEPILPPVSSADNGKINDFGPATREVTDITPKGGTLANSPHLGAAGNDTAINNSPPLVRADASPLGPKMNAENSGGHVAASTPRVEALSNQTLKTPLENSPYQSGMASDTGVARPESRLNTYDSNISANLSNEIVSRKITLPGPATEILPSFTLADRSRQVPVNPGEPIGLESLPKAHLPQTEIKLLEVASNKTEIRPENIKSILHYASNVQIELNQSEQGLLHLSPIIQSDHLSLRLTNLLHAEKEFFTPESVQRAKLTRATELVRLINLSGENSIIVMARHLNLRGAIPTIFDIRGQEATKTAMNSNGISYALSTSDRRAPAIMGRIMNALGIRGGENPAVPGESKIILHTGLKGDLSAQGILKPQFSLTRGDNFTPTTFAIRDLRVNGTMSDVRFPGQLELGRRKKKKKDGEEEDECAANTNAESCRYISGLELGLLIALAGIARNERPDRSNRQVANIDQSEKSRLNSKTDSSKMSNLIFDAIQKNKIEKRLPSFNWEHQWRAPGKIKVKNQLKKLKEEMKELKAQEIEKLESSTNSEELLDRLGKIVAKDEKRLDAKRLLSKFGATLEEKPNQKKNQVTSSQNQIVGFRPLWLVAPKDTLTKLGELIYQDPDVGWLIADMNSKQIKETWIDGKRVIEMQSRQQIELPIQEDIDLFKISKPKEAIAENLITIVQVNQLDKELIESQLQTLQIKRRAFGTT